MHILMCSEMYWKNALWMILLTYTPTSHIWQFPHLPPHWMLSFVFKFLYLHLLILAACLNLLLLLVIFNTFFFFYFYSFKNYILCVHSSFSLVEHLSFIYHFKYNIAETNYCTLIKWEYFSSHGSPVKIFVDWCRHSRN